jgi:hypothetical protein
MKCRLSFLVGVPVILGLCLLGISNQVTSQQKEQEKTKPKPVDKKPIDMKPSGGAGGGVPGVAVEKSINLKPPIDGKPVDKKPIDKKPVDDRWSPEQRAKAEALERELLRSLPPEPVDPELRRVLLDGDPESTLRKLLPVPLPVIPKPCVITAGDIDGFQYNPQTDQVSPCCIKIKSRNFDEPGINKPFSHQVRIPCCKILAIRCEVRIRNEGELSSNDRLYVAIPGAACQNVWYSDISALDKSWPGPTGSVHTISWWLPPASVQQINRYIFEQARGCDCFLCLLSQDDHAVDYWRLFVYCCECPTVPRGVGSPIPEGSITR